MKIDGVFEGGGVRGIAHVGAICALNERGYSFERVAGTSAGAIIAALLAKWLLLYRIKRYNKYFRLLSIYEKNVT